MEPSVPPGLLSNASWTTAPPPPPLCASAVTSYVLPSAYALLSLTGLLGNVLSLWVFLGRISAAASNPVHLCLSHLSVSNVLLSLITPLMAAYFARGAAWPLRGFPCQLVLQFVTPVFYVNTNISIFILAWVALSRFAALVQHTHSSPGAGCCARLLPARLLAALTRRRTASWVCTGVWVLAVGVTLPCCMIYSIMEAVEGDGGDGGQHEVCYSYNVEVGGSLSATLLWPFLAFFYLLYAMVLLFYAVVLKHIRQSRRSTTRTTTQALLGRVHRNIVVIQVARLPILRLSFISISFLFILALLSDSLCTV